MIETIIQITVVLHLIGVATLLGGFLYQISELKNGAKVLPAMLHGAWLLLITGFALTGLVYANGEEVNNIVLAIKGANITAIFFIAYAYAKKEKTPKWVVPVLGALTLVNLTLAVLPGVILES